MMDEQSAFDPASFAEAPPNNMDAYWMPFTANRQFKANPRLLVAAKDMHYVNHRGEAVLDGTAGLWCVNAGHGRPKIVEAIQKQAEVLDYAPSFQMGHPRAFDLAARLAGMAPDGLDHVFFTNSGSESVDTALKIALAYHRIRGEGHRTRLIGRERGYHGVGFGGISVGGMSNNRKHFSLLGDVDHLPHTHNLEHMAFSRGQPDWGGHLADELENIVALHDASNIAAVIVEPFAGSGGVIIPPKGYLEKLRAITKKHGILLIFDEVITGFGRLGGSFASEVLGVVPDLITTAKGISNGCVPMGAVFASKEIYGRFMQGPESVIELFHGYTYSAHPLACAAAHATLDTYIEEGLFQRAADLAPYWEDALHSLNGTDTVVDIRNIGLAGAVEVRPHSSGAGKRAYDIFLRCYESGLLVRWTGDTLAVTPPLIISKEQIGELVDKLGRAIRDSAASMGA